MKNKITTDIESGKISKRQIDGYFFDRLVVPEIKWAALHEFIVYFYDRPEVHVKASSHEMAATLAKAYIIHRYGSGWAVEKIVSSETGMYLPDQKHAEEEE